MTSLRVVIPLYSSFRHDLFRKPVATFRDHALCRLPARQIAAAVLPSRASKPREERMAADSVYKVIELIGTSSESWEKAARTAVERAAESLRDLRIAEVAAQDVQLKDGKVELFRTKLKVSFKYEKGSD